MISSDAVLASIVLALLAGGFALAGAIEAGFFVLVAAWLVAMLAADEERSGRAEARRRNRR